MTKAYYCQAQEVERGYVDRLEIPTTGLKEIVTFQLKIREINRKHRK
jgi:hypothetical protein